MRLISWKISHYFFLDIRIHKKRWFWERIRSIVYLLAESMYCILQMKTTLKFSSDLSE